MALKLLTLSTVLMLAANNGLLVAAFYCPNKTVKCTCDAIHKYVSCTKLGLHSPPLDLPEDLVHLDLTNNFIQTWQPNWLQNLSKLSQLKLSQNRLTEPPPGVCSNLPSLQSLFLDNNQLNASLPSDYKDCHKLTRLTLSNNKFTVLDNTTLCSLGASEPPSEPISIKLNQLSKLTAKGIQPGALACLSNRLISLDLSGNSLPQSSLEALIGGSKLGKLQSLNLKMSTILVTVTQELIFGAKSLQTLTFDGSPKLTSIHSQALAKTPLLRQLSLRKTHISGWNDSCLDQLSHLEKLDLRNTSVTTIGGFNGSDVNSLRQLTDNEKFSVNLTGAALACDCTLYWLTQQLKQPKILARVSDATRLTCAQPAAMRGRRLLDFAPANCEPLPPGFFTPKMIVILVSSGAGGLLLLCLATVGVVFACRRCRSPDGSEDLRNPLVISSSSRSSLASDVGATEATRGESVWIRLRRFLRQRREASSQQRQPIYSPPDPDPEDYLSSNTA